MWFIADLHIHSHYSVATSKAMEPEKARRIKATLMLACSQDAEASGNGEEALSFARKAHSQMPEFLPASVQLATLSAAAGKTRAADRIEANKNDLHPRRWHRRLENAGRLC